ncbi:hypothetical protein DFR86_02710 [Acidianus sulfidivorans JP7]|uniref:Uncharacterized protein n=1 Tax=Acidianus sulfidivorans JP7 TaxID=619593 RepID=A0A2U9IKQ1_9CREN|nr:hypothetical protein [Acidianus sulfidivorans]AWR96565.1 hypothetical protein DFR86_02710 [Acidianus sulfidivorans JP7]
MESVTSFILVMATLVMGLVSVGLFASYGSIVYSNTVSLQQAQYFASGLRVTMGKSSGNIVPIIIDDYNYNGTIYLVAFYSTVDNPEYFTPNYATINSTSPQSGNAEIKTLNNGILYEGEIQYYVSHTGDIQFISINPKYYTIIWIIASYYLIGYEVIP